MRLLFLLILIPLISLAQPKGWQELTISDGLSQGMIFALKQDRKGFIWIATKDGLNRYDGHNFLVFTHDSNNDFSLTENYCSALLIDRQQRLWVGTWSQGLNLFDERTQRFYHINISDQTAPNAGNYEIRFLTEDPDGNIWVGTDKNKLFKISLPASLRDQLPDQSNFTKQVRLKQLSFSAVGPNNLFHYINFRPDGQAVVGTTYGTYGLNWRQAAGIVPLNGSGGKEYYASYGDSKQNIWAVTTSDNIICRRYGSQKKIPLPKRTYTSVSLRAIDSATVAIATMDHLWVMSLADLFRQDSLTDRNAFAELPPNVYAITDLMRDRTGMIWVGTSGYGLRKFNPKIKQFHSYLPNTTLSYLYPDQQGRIYVRYEFAYARLDRPNNRLLPFLGDDLPPADKRQRYMVQARNGIFWVSNVNFQTHEQHLFKFSSDWQLLRKYPLPPGTSFGFYGNQTIEDKAGSIWIGATNGKLLRFNPATETFQSFSYESLLPRSGAEIEVYSLYFDQAGTLWIGTQKGLVKARGLEAKPKFSIYKNIRTDRRSLSNDFVSSLIDDPKGPERYLWVGTKGGGLERLNKQTGQFDHFTEAQGLSNKVVYGILPDALGNLWVSTNRGVAQFNPKTLTFRSYTKADGLQDDEFNTGSYAKTPSGELLFGGVSGLTAFRAEVVARSAGRRPLANIIGLRVNNETIAVGGSDGILSESIEHVRALDLAPDQNQLTLEFGVMDYTNSDQNRYRYRLNGLDQDWIDAGTNRFANYARLPAGTYTLQMIGSSDGEVWSLPVQLVVRVHPPFYQTWWAYLFYALAFGGIGWQLYRFQTQRLLLKQHLIFEQKEASRLAELNALKTQFFTNISHEFRTPLTLILGPAEQATRAYPTDKRFPMIQRNANRLLSLINQLLDLSKLEAGQLKVKTEPGDLAAFFRIIAGSFSSQAESQGIRFAFSQNEPTYWANFDHDKVEKITTNLLSNAVKFTPTDHEIRMIVDFPADQVSGLLTLLIQDTGIGIAPNNLAHIFERFYQVDDQANRSYEGTGVGLALIRELVGVLKGTIDVVSTEGSGTTFTVRLPLLAVPVPDDAESACRPATAYDQLMPDSQSPDLETAHQILPQTGSLLVVDDNADIRTFIRAIFEQDYQIIEATDGQDGLEKATALLPDVVICDLMMPRLDGLGFCRALKTQEATSHIPVVMLTAKATAQDRIDGFELGADDYLTKPFNQTEIQIRVRNLVQQRERLYQHLTSKISVSSQSATVPLTAEQKFIDRLTAIVLQHIDDTTFTVEALAEAANLSRVQLHRKLKALTNTTATYFIREIRLTKAAEQLIMGEESVTQVAYGVGFDNLSYFAKVFQERYGVLPSQYGKSETLISSDRIEQNDG